MVPCAPSNMTAAAVEDVVEQAACVGDEGTDLLSGGGVLVVDFLGVDGIGAEEGVGDGVLFLRRRFRCGS
jgi:hypothetical protein